jgi:hypothetical protein
VPNSVICGKNEHLRKVRRLSFFTRFYRPQPPALCLMRRVCGTYSRRIFSLPLRCPIVGDSSLIESAWISIHQSRLVYHVDQLRAGFASRTGRKCDTCKALEFSTLWFGTRRSKVQILSPRPLSPLFSLGYSLCRCCLQNL